MHEYDFQIRFRLADSGADPEQYLGALLTAKLTDVTVGIGKKGSIAMMFTRKATSAPEAIADAIREVCQAIPGAQVVQTAIEKDEPG